VLLHENDRWIEARWSPNSHYLAMTDGSDGHVTDIFVYRVSSVKQMPAEEAPRHFTHPSGGDFATLTSTARMKARLCYHTPNLWTYDVMWSVRGWDTANEEILVRKRTLQGIFKERGDLSFSGVLER